jgi:hypothetical protein
MKNIKKFRILEFLIFGIISNMADNLITFYFVGNQEINIRILLITLAVVVPFGIIEELIVDHPNFWVKVGKICRIKFDF